MTSSCGRPLQFVVIAWLAVSLAPMALAQTPALASPQTSVVFYTENDDWPPDTGTDKNYTNGFRLTLERNADLFGLQRLALFGWVPKYGSCETAEGGVTCLSSAFHFGQQFYTPDDISVPFLQPRDRPYAGWLYVGGSWKAANERHLVATDVYFGATGPASLARQVQTNWHKLVGATKPSGWSHQINNRFGIVIGHNRHWAYDGVASGHRWFELSPFLGGTAGNIVTDAYLGGRAKIGWNITRDWSHDAIAPVNADASKAQSGLFEAYVSADVRGRVVPYNVFIDAADGHDLHRRHVVNDGGLGVGVRIGPISASYRIARISREYDEAPSTHEFKALKFTYVVR